MRACVRACVQMAVERGRRPERAHDVVVEELEAALVDVAALLAVEASARRHQLHLDRRREVEVELGDDQRWLVSLDHLVCVRVYVCACRCSVCLSVRLSV